MRLIVLASYVLRVCVHAAAWYYINYHKVACETVHIYTYTNTFILYGARLSRRWQQHKKLQMCGKIIILFIRTVSACVRKAKTFVEELNDRAVYVASSSKNGQSKDMKATNRTVSVLCLCTARSEFRYVYAKFSKSADGLFSIVSLSKFCEYFIV